MRSEHSRVGRRSMKPRSAGLRGSGSSRVAEGEPLHAYHRPFPACRGRSGSVVPAGMASTADGSMHPSVRWGAVVVAGKVPVDHDRTKPGCDEVPASVCARPPGAVCSGMGRSAGEPERGGDGSGDAGEEGEQGVRQVMDGQAYAAQSQVEEGVFGRVLTASGHAVPPFCWFVCGRAGRESAAPPCLREWKETGGEGLRGGKGVRQGPRWAFALFHRARK